LYQEVVAGSTLGLFVEKVIDSLSGGPLTAGTRAHAG
jgi:hypothetical protein